MCLFDRLFVGLVMDVKVAPDDRNRKADQNDADDGQKRSRQSTPCEIHGKNSYEQKSFGRGSEFLKIR